VDLADDPELMDLMVRAGFNKVFLGLETPEPENLKECGKVQNLRRSLDESAHHPESRIGRDGRFYYRI
jgi:radical SAM superfamily enzyme YgiQ (UPF0313 family)